MTLEAERCEQCGFMIPGWAKEEHEAQHRVTTTAAGVEELAALFHGIYQREAKRQGNVRHPDAFADLPENVKEFDRALARFVLLRDEAIRAEAQPARHKHEPRCYAPDGGLQCGRAEAQPAPALAHSNYMHPCVPENTVVTNGPAPDAKWEEAVTRIVNYWLMANGTKSDLIAALLAAGQSAQPVNDTVWLVFQNERVHSVHCSREHALREQGENLKVDSAAWRVLGAAQPVVTAEMLRDVCVNDDNKSWQDEADALNRLLRQSAQPTVTAEKMAQMFHEAYERLAPQFSYKTREASAVPWDKVPENSRKLIIATCAAVLRQSASEEKP